MKAKLEADDQHIKPTVPRIDVQIVQKAGKEVLTLRKNNDNAVTNNKSINLKAKADVVPISVKAGNGNAKLKGIPKAEETTKAKQGKPAPNSVSLVCQ